MAAIDAKTLDEKLRDAQSAFWLHVEAASPLEKFPAKQHAGRVVEKLGVQEGLIYLPGTPAQNIEDSDMPVPWRQRRYFYYLSGCNEADCHLTYDIQHDELTLFIPKHDQRTVLYYGPGLTKQEALDKYDIDQVKYVDKLHQHISHWTTCNKGSLYILHPSQNPLIAGMHGPVDLRSLLPAINLARMVKDDHEIHLIKKANDISSHAHREVLSNILKFKNEAQVEGLFVDVCTSSQAKEQAYHVIAASGPNAGTLHYDSNNEDFKGRQLICLDAGCEWDLYASDITRTFPLTGDWPSKEAQDIYRLVERMQETCIERVAPGVRYLDLHILAHQIAIDGLLSLGILHNGTREEIYKAGTSRAFFPHGLGHHVGLDVHDVGQEDLMSMMRDSLINEKAPSLYPENFHVPVYDPKMCRSPVDPQSGHLEEGNVVTIEPGIYFSTYLLNLVYLPSPIHSKYINTLVVQKYLPVGGVRIEDDILVTSKGYENLTTAPKGEEMLEVIRSQGNNLRSRSEPADISLSRSSARKCKTNEPEPQVRAPGISPDIPEPILRPIYRAATLPVEKKDRSLVDFEQFEGPSLYSNFKRSSTIDVPQRAGHLKSYAPTRSGERKMRTPICGEDAPAYEHAYMDFQNGSESSRSSGTKEHWTQKKPACSKCTILAQTLDRLRKNLSDPALSLQKLAPEKKPEISVHKQPEMKQRQPTSRSESLISQTSSRTLTSEGWRPLIEETDTPRELDDIPMPLNQNAQIPRSLLYSSPKALPVQEIPVNWDSQLRQLQRNYWATAPHIAESGSVDSAPKPVRTHVDKQAPLPPALDLATNLFKNLSLNPTPLKHAVSNRRSVTFDSYPREQNPTFTPRTTLSNNRQSYQARQLVSQSPNPNNPFLQENTPFGPRPISTSTPQEPLPQRERQRHSYQDAAATTLRSRPSLPVFSTNQSIPGELEIPSQQQRERERQRLSQSHPHRPNHPIPQNPSQAFPPSIQSMPPPQPRATPSYSTLNQGDPAQAMAPVVPSFAAQSRHAERERRRYQAFVDMQAAPPQTQMQTQARDDRENRNLGLFHSHG